jgi:hypothetical protein
MAYPSLDDHKKTSDKVGLVDAYEGILSKSIGCLSAFIIRKHYDRLTGHGKIGLRSKSASVLARTVADEITVLVGTNRAESILTEFETINRRFFKGEDEDEG